MPKNKSCGAEQRARENTVTRAYFENLVNVSEASYDHKISLLLRYIDIADREEDCKDLEKAKELVLAWQDFFIAMKEVSEKEKIAGKCPQDIEVRFVNDQIKFFEKLGREIAKKIKELKAKKIRKSLE